MNEPGQVHAAHRSTRGYETDACREQDEQMSSLDALRVLSRVRLLRGLPASGLRATSRGKRGIGIEGRGGKGKGADAADHGDSAGATFHEGYGDSEKARSEPPDRVADTYRIDSAGHKGRWGDAVTFEYDGVVVRRSVNQPSLETRYCHHAWRLGDENERTLSGGLAMPAVYVCAFCGLHCTPYWVSTEYDAQVGLVVTS